MCDNCHQKHDWFSTMLRLKTCSVRASFGFVEPLRWEARMPRSLIGKSSATETSVVSWR